jgi:hypothetical protein
MFAVKASAAGRRPGRIVLGMMAGVLSASAAYALAAPAQAAPAQQAQAAPTTRMFASDGGMVLNFIKPDKGPDFEAVMAKLKEALQKSEKPERKQQAQSWKVFKSPDPAAAGNLLYVFIIDPSVKGADYTVSNILAEAFPPAEVNELYKKYADSYATGQNFVNLTLVADLK